MSKLPDRPLKNMHTCTYPTHHQFDALSNKLEISKSQTLQSLIGKLGIQGSDSVGKSTSSVGMGS